LVDVAGVAFVLEFDDPGGGRLGEDLTVVALAEGLIVEVL